MEKERLKKIIIQKILECEDLEVLKELEEVLLKYSEVREGNADYLKESHSVPASHYQRLEKEFEDYKSGKVEAVGWEEFRKEIKSKYGF